jgi:hypothetical protein
MILEVELLKNSFVPGVDCKGVVDSGDEFRVG